MSKRKLLLSAIFAAGMVSVPAVAGDMQVLNEEDLEEVSAQGLQTIDNDTRDFAPVNGQNNNLDSVQMNDNAQQNVTLALIINSAKSALNSGVNLLYDGGGSSGGSSGGGGSTPEPKDPDANIDYIVDKTKQHIFDPQPSGSFDYEFDQENDQYAYNHMNSAYSWDGDARAENVNKQTQTVTNNGDIVDQDNNNNSVQLNDNAQQYASGLLIENSATSASNFGLNVFVSGSVTGTYGNQYNWGTAENMTNYADADGDTGDAYAMNKEDGKTQSVDNKYGISTDSGFDTNDITDQDNNNNSVQLNDNAQQEINGVAVMNVAQSAVNLAGNLMAISSVSESSLYQENGQEAYNHMNNAFSWAGDASAINENKQSQEVINADTENYEGTTSTITEQNNNNNSVQLNDNAQQYATAFYLANAANSAINAGVNIMAVYGGSPSSVSDSELYQGNYAWAENFTNWADGGVNATASNRETTENPDQHIPGQHIKNRHTTVLDQNNNNNSVQLNDNAQQNAEAFVLLNSAMSAVNVGANIIYVDGNVSGSGIDQWNDQYAYSHYNEAYAYAGHAEASNINKQTQTIENCFCSNLSSTDQDNNMNSVQLNDNAQQNATALILVNSADSAVNMAANLAITTGTFTGSYVYQYNYNEAYNFSNYADGASATATNAEGFSF